MDTISREELFQTIKKVATDEEQYLNSHFGQGIFFVPELAFAYMCGKAIMENHSRILGNYEYEWIREKGYEKYGIADLVLEPKNGGPEIVMEFKMDDKINKYKRDVDKLKLLEGEHTRFFCALKWVFSHQVEGYLNELKNEFESNLIDSKSFITKVKGSNQDNQCLLTLWEIC